MRVSFPPLNQLERSQPAALGPELLQFRLWASCHGVSIPIRRERTRAPEVGI